MRKSKFKFKMEYQVFYIQAFNQDIQIIHYSFVQKLPGIIMLFIGLQQ